MASATIVLNTGDSRLNSSKNQILKAWLPSAVWMAVICLESTNLASSANTGRVLYPLFHFLFSINPAQFAVIHHLLRKTGHFVGYFTLSVLLFRSWSVSLAGLAERWCVQWAGLAFVQTALVASLDEWHQTFLPSRTGLFSDVVLDCSAGLVAQIVIFLLRQAQASRATVEPVRTPVMFQDSADDPKEFYSEQHR